MFGRKKKENNEDSVAWYPPNESEVVDQGEMINSLAVFAKADEPIYKEPEKTKKKIEYKMNIGSKFYMICSENLEWVGNQKYSYFCYPKINLNCESLKKQINTPIANKIVIDLDKKYYNHKSELLFKNDKYIIYGIPLESCHKYDETYGERFYMTILCLSGNEKDRYVDTLLVFDIYDHCHGFLYPQYSFYKNPYFLSSLFQFMSEQTGREITYEIFNNLGLFDNTIEI